jgi:hypothetical protein
MGLFPVGNLVLNSIEHSIDARVYRAELVIQRFDCLPFFHDLLNFAPMLGGCSENALAQVSSRKIAMAENRIVDYAQEQIYSRPKNGCWRSPEVAVDEKGDYTRKTCASWCGVCPQGQ